MKFDFNVLFVCLDFVLCSVWMLRICGRNLRKYDSEIFDFLCDLTMINTAFLVKFTEKLGKELFGNQDVRNFG